MTLTPLFRLPLPKAEAERPNVCEKHRHQESHGRGCGPTQEKSQPYKQAASKLPNRLKGTSEARTTDCARLPPQARRFGADGAAECNEQQRQRIKRASTSRTGAAARNLCHGYRPAVGALRRRQGGSTEREWPLR